VQPNPRNLVTPIIESMRTPTRNHTVAAKRRPKLKFLGVRFSSLPNILCCGRYSRYNLPIRTNAEITMRHFALIIVLSLGASLAVRAEDQGPVEKTGKTVEKAATKTGQTVEHAASATGQTVKHGAQATERTVGKGLSKTGSTLEKAGNGVTKKHHAQTKHAAAKSSPSPSPSATPVSTPSPTPAPTPESTPVATPTPVETTPTPGPVSTPTPGE
jgi:hypothetical protein